MLTDRATIADAKRLQGQAHPRYGHLPCEALTAEGWLPGRCAAEPSSLPGARRLFSTARHGETAASSRSAGHFVTRDELAALLEVTEIRTTYSGQAWLAVLQRAGPAASSVGTAVSPG